MLALALLLGGKNTFVVRLSGRNHAKNDACQFVGGSRDRGRPSQAGGHFAVKDAQLGSAPFQGLGRQPQGAIYAMGTPAGFGRENFPSALLMVRAKASPRSKGMEVAKLRPVGSHFRQQGVAGECVDGGEGGQIPAKYAIQLAPHSKAKLVFAP
jgi:hypothetical protein